MTQVRWVWVNLPYATFGIEVRDGKVKSAAPIGKWMTGKSTAFIKEWITKKGGRWKVIDL